MISETTLRQWFPREETPAEWLERRCRLRKQHRELEREIHGRGK